MTQCPQVNPILSNRWSRKDLLSEISPGQDLEFVVGLNDGDDPGDGGDQHLVARGNG